MFGYVRICRQELRDEDFELFNAYYCGLCKTIGKYSNTARLGLSYDMTFLAILLSAISDVESEAAQIRCALHPVNRKKAVKNNKILDYAANMSILLSYRKLDDDWRDDKTAKSFAGKLLFRRAVKKASILYPEEDRTIGVMLSKISELEKKNCQDIDEIADCFAKICEKIFVPDIIYDENNKKVLSWLGYNIGRWIYIIDAFDDLKKDIKNKKFNPLSDRIRDEEKDILKLAKDIEVTLTYTLSNIAAAYDILEVKQNDNILRNILYAGLPGMQAEILNIQEEKNGSV